MVQESSTRTKTQTLSLRLDPKTRFILEFMSKVRGQSITVVVERAIKEASEKAGIGPTHNQHGNEIPQSIWTDFWDPDEGVRNLKLLTHDDYPTSYEEDEIRRFTLDHWEFFYASDTGKTVRRAYAGLLWPQLHKYLAIWRATKGEDYWAAGKKMAEDLSRANLSSPTWPRESKAEQKKTAVFTRDLDDEVPF